MAAKKPSKRPASAGPSEQSDAQVDAIVAKHYADEIERRRAAIERGDGDALLDALLVLCISEAPMPNWLTFKVAAAIRRYTHHECATLDEAFGITRPKNYQRRVARERRQNAFLLYSDVVELHSAGVPIDNQLLELVGEQHGVGRTKAWEWYHHEKKRLPWVTFGHRVPEALSKPHLKKIYQLHRARPADS